MRLNFFASRLHSESFMKILKFGGTSLGTPERMQHVANLIQNSDRKVVVLSAVSGTTNALVTINQLSKEGKIEKCTKAVEELRDHYKTYIHNLLLKEDSRSKAAEFVNAILDEIIARSTTSYSHVIEKENLAQGEIISTNLMSFYLQEMGIKSVLLPALSFMRTNNGEPNVEVIQLRIEKEMIPYQNDLLFITQGYICLNERGEVDNLRRGGSDYTASLLGAATDAEEIQIWTDIDGMHNNDPRIVDRTFPVHELSFDEAAELAYFGAKILHPSSVLPAQQANVPVRLLNTMKPEAQGTLITSQTTARRIKAIAAKDGIIAVKVKSSRMLMAYGFLRKVFEVFERYETSIDMITTSEVAVSLTIDDDSNLDAITAALRQFGQVEIDRDQSIICVVGQFLQNDTAIVVRVLDAMEEIPIRMISYGGSKNNVSLLVHKNDKNHSLKLLNERLFEEFSVEQ